MVKVDSTTTAFRLRQRLPSTWTACLDGICMPKLRGVPRPLSRMDNKESRMHAASLQGLKSRQSRLLQRELGIGALLLIIGLVYVVERL